MSCVCLYSWSQQSNLKQKHGWDGCTILKSKISKIFMEKHKPGKVRLVGRPTISWSSWETFLGEWRIDDKFCPFATSADDKLLFRFDVETEELLVFIEWVPLTAPPSASLLETESELYSGSRLLLSREEGLLASLSTSRELCEPSLAKSLVFLLEPCRIYKHETSYLIRTSQKNHTAKGSPNRKVKHAHQAMIFSSTTRCPLH